MIEPMATPAAARLQSTPKRVVSLLVGASVGYEHLPFDLATARRRF
jgi:hypothetical protein